MKSMYSTWLGPALAVVVLTASPARSLAADPKDHTVVGRIVKIQPATGRLTLQTTQGNLLELSLDARSQVRLQDAPANLNQLREGARVRVTYQQIGSTNHVVSLRDAPVTAEDIRQELREALETTKAYTYQQRQEYQKRLEPVLHDLDDRIEALKEQAKGASREAQKRSAEAIEELRREREVVRKHLARVQAAAPGAWEEVKSGMSAAWDDLRKAFQRAHERLQEGSPSDRP